MSKGEIDKWHDSWLLRQKQIREDEMARKKSKEEKPKKWKAHRIFGNSDKVEVVEV